MTEKEKELQIEIERLEEWIKEYKICSKSDAEIHQKTLKENKELTNKIIVDTVKASGVDLKNNREETIIKIIKASLFKNEEMLRKVETAPKDKITLNVEKGGYELRVSTIPSQIIRIYRTAEEIEEIMKKLEKPKEETTTTLQAEEIKESQENKANNEEEYIGQKSENNKIAEMESMLKNSQYSWMKVEPVPELGKWQIIDIRNGRVCFQERPYIVYETIKEITQETK